MCNFCAANLHEAPAVPMLVATNVLKDRRHTLIVLGACGPDACCHNIARTTRLSASRCTGA